MASGQGRLGREHGLGTGREAGDRLCQLVQEDIQVPAPVPAPKGAQSPTPKLAPGSFIFKLRKQALKDAELYDGHYLLRSNLSDKEPEWHVETLHAPGGDRRSLH